MPREAIEGRRIKGSHSDPIPIVAPRAIEMELKSIIARARHVRALSFRVRVLRAGNRRGKADRLPEADPHLLITLTPSAIKQR
jgi:hypothetical protein